jgi:Polysaccharide lyase
MPDSAATRSAGRLHPTNRATTPTSARSRWRPPPSRSRGTPPPFPRSTSPKRAFLVLLFVVAFLGATAVIYGMPGAASATKPQCNNQLDDDGDGKIDYPTDPGCTGRGDKSEIDPIQPPPRPGEVRYSKKGEPLDTNVFGLNSLEEPCWPSTTPWTSGAYSLDYCRWYKVTQYDPPQCGPYRDFNDPFAGSSSIRYDVATGSVTTRCEIGHNRRVDAYSDDWYHTAFKLESDWGETNQGGTHINQLNYNSICAYQLALHVDDLNDSGYLTVYAGAEDQTKPNGWCPYYSGQPIGQGFAPRPAGMPGPFYVIPPGQLARNVWHEVLIHIYWTPLNEGVVEGWYKRKGETAWAKNLDVGPVGSGRSLQFNFPTLQTGTQAVPGGCPTVTVANINDDCHWPAEDKMGQYTSGYTSANGTATMWGEFCRASTREAAETCLG